MRKTADERRHEIIAAATDVMSERGYYGSTLQEIADRAQISQAGLIKYVKNKEGLLRLVLDDYDSNNQADRYLNEKLAQSPEDLARNPPLMPAWYRAIAREAVRRPKQTRLYTMLRAEGIDPKHPAHAYYAGRGERLREWVASIPWKLPEEYRTPKQVEYLSMAVGSAMDGLELRWFGEPDIDFLGTWAIFEDIFFPLPHWEGYR